MNPQTKKSIFLSLSILALIGAVFLVAPHAHAMTPVQDVLKPGTTEGDAVRRVWNALLALANSLLVVVLLVIAFSNILHIQLDSYAIKKSLPTLIIGIVLANFSYFICRAIVDVTNMLLSYLVQTAGTGAGQMVTNMGGMKDATGVSGWGTTININAGPPKPEAGSVFWSNSFAYLGGQVARIIGAVFIAALGYLMFIRNWVLYFLVALSPLGFVAMAIPQGKTVFQSWWKNFSQWAFMPIVAYFWVWVGAAFLGSGIAQSASGGGTGFTMIWAFAIACYYFALTTPFKMGGAIMKAWGGFGQKVVGGASDLVKNRVVKPWWDEKKQDMSNWYMNNAREGKGITGRWGRRALLTVDRRDRKKKRGEGLRDEGMGRALEEGLTLAQRRERQNYLLTSEGYLGETKRRELRAREDFITSDPRGRGREHRRATDAYNREIENLETELKLVDKMIGTEAVEGAPAYFQDEHGNQKMSGKNRSRQSIIDQQRDLKMRFSQAELTGNKMQQDDLNKQIFDGGPVDLQIQAYQQLEKHIKELEDPNSKASEDLTSEERNTLKDSFRQDMDKVKKSYLESIIEMGDGLTPTIMKMTGITGEKGNWNYNSLDMGKAQKLSQLNGFVDGSPGMKLADDRITKMISLAYKDELAVEAGKRAPVESGRLSDRNFGQEEKDTSGQRIKSTTDKLWLGELDGRKASRDVYAMVGNLTTAVKSSINAEFLPAMEILAGQLRRASSHTDGFFARDITSKTMSDALSAVFASPLYLKASKEAYKTALSEAKVNSAKYTDNTGTEKEIAITDQRSYQQAITTLRSDGSDTARIEADRLESERAGVVDAHHKGAKKAFSEMPDGVDLGELETAGYQIMLETGDHGQVKLSKNGVVTGAVRSQEEAERKAEAAEKLIVDLASRGPRHILSGAIAGAISTNAAPTRKEGGKHYEESAVQQNINKTMGDAQRMKDANRRTRQGGGQP